MHMERKEEALAAIEALNGTMFKGRQLAVELSKAQPLVNQLVSSGNSGGDRERHDTWHTFNCEARSCLWSKVFLVICLLQVVSFHGLIHH